MISDMTINWIIGCIGFITLAGGVLVFVNQIKNIKCKADDEKKAAVAIAVADAKVETESAFEFRQLKESVNETNRAIQTLSGVVNVQMGDIQGKISQHDREIIELTESTKQFHKRMDEHRRVDHRWATSKEKEGE